MYAYWGVSAQFAKWLREQEPQFRLNKWLHYLNKTKGFKYGKLCKWIDYKYIDYD